MNKKNTFLKISIVIFVICLACFICSRTIFRPAPPAVDTEEDSELDSADVSGNSTVSESVLADEDSPDAISTDEFFSICDNYARALVSGNIVIPETIYTSFKFDGPTASSHAVFSVSSWDLEGDVLTLNENVRFPCSIKMERMENGEIGYAIENLGSVLDMDMSNTNEYEHLIWMIYLREANNFKIQRQHVLKEYAEANDLDISGFEVDGEFTSLPDYDQLPITVSADSAEGDS